MRPMRSGRSCRRRTPSGSGLSSSASIAPTPASIRSAWWRVHTGQGWYRYITNVLDPTILPASDVADLYGQRWRIEEAFSLVKRLLGLSYLWTGAANGIALQVWATWLLYAVLIDLCDQIAEVKALPLQRISVEMVYRGLYHFAGAVQRGEATDPVTYLAGQDRPRHREAIAASPYAV